MIFRKLREVFAGEASSGSTPPIAITASIEPGSHTDQVTLTLVNHTTAPIERARIIVMVPFKLVPAAQSSRLVEHYRLGAPGSHWGLQLTHEATLLNFHAGAHVFPADSSTELLTLGIPVLREPSSSYIEYQLTAADLGNLLGRCDLPQTPKSHPDNRVAQ